MMVSGLGDSQQKILEHLKRRGSSTILSLADALDLNVETVRAHLRALGSDGWTRRAGSRRDGPGRPEILYGLTDAAEALFPSREGRVLSDLATFLLERGADDVLDRFFDDYVDSRRGAALERVEGLEGDERLEEVVRILSEDGFMAELGAADDGTRVLRLCHCPMRGLVDVTKAPCRAELGYVRDLLGAGLARVGYIPSGDAACCYTVAPEG